MRTRQNLALRFRRDAHGTVMVETGLALLLAFPVIFSAFELCIFTYTQAILGDAARVGVRYAIIHGTDSTTCSGPSSGCSDQSGANVTTMVQNYAAASLNSLSGITVTPSWPDSSSAPPSRVIVTVTYTYSPFFPNTGLSMAMNATAEGRIVY
jgi:Flp pilus assembly protein TadG